MSASPATVFHRLTQGVYVIGVADGAARNAFTAVWLMQVSFDPMLLALSINPQHSSYALLQRGRAFSVNVLGSDQLPMAAHFGQAAIADKLASVPTEIGITGTPLLPMAIAWLECRLVDEVPAGDHVLILGEAVNGALRAPTAVPLTYRDTGALDGAEALYPPEFRARV